MAALLLLGVAAYLLLTNNETKPKEETPIEPKPKEETPIEPKPKRQRKKKDAPFRKADDIQRGSISGGGPRADGSKPDRSSVIKRTIVEEYISNGDEKTESGGSPESKESKAGTTPEA